MMIVEENTRAVIEQLYPQELFPNERASAIAAAAELHGLTERHIRLWLHDLPLHELSVPHFLEFCRRYNFLP